MPSRMMIYRVGTIRRFICTQGNAPSGGVSQRRGGAIGITSSIAGRPIHILKSVARRVIGSLLKIVVRHGATVRLIFRRVSDVADRVTRPGAVGERIFARAVRAAAVGSPQVALGLLAIIRTGLALAVQIHLAASAKERAMRAARISNLLFRCEIRAWRGAAAFLYYEVLFMCRRYDRIVREVGGRKHIDGHFLNFAIGMAHLYLLRTDEAQYYLGRVVALSDGKDSLSLRRLGCVFLVQDNYALAADYFQKSVAADPKSVMAHQNYAGRYDPSKYNPPSWELENAGDLLVYDNLVQLAEHFYQQGQYKETFTFYQKAMRYQASIRDRFPIPAELVRVVADKFAHFNPNLPIRLLGPEWVTQIGHIAALDCLQRMARLGLAPDANYVLLAPRNKVANVAYLDYWKEWICVLDDQPLIDELFSYQRSVGDQFIAVMGDGHLAEPWQHAAARAQCIWASQGRGPMIQLTDADRVRGKQTLAAAGVTPDNWYVGLHVREGGFYGDGAGTVAAHRSAHIEDYIGAIEEITSLGGWVIRLGDRSMTRLRSMPRVIDYAHSPMKSSWMDVFLFATSRFVIGTTSGLSTAVQSFGTPMLITNAISNDCQSWPANVEFILKRVYDFRRKRYLSLHETYREPVRSYLINNEILRRHGYEVRSNTSDEIRRAVQHRLKTISAPSSKAVDDEPLMKKYRERIAFDPYIFGAANPSLSFLDCYPEFIEE